MPRLSILTAAYGPSATYLPETAESVSAQVLPADWDLEWIIQEDGDDPILRSALVHNPMVKYEANGLRLGIGATRNMALSRATGDLVQVLDHDDLLLPGALALLVEKFEQHPIGWAVAAADDLMEDGSRKSWDSDLPFGVVPAGAANRWAEDHGGNWPVHCAGLMMRTDAVRALGGWAGAPVDDDIVLFAALSELSQGWNEARVTWLYRQHAAQTSRSATWRSMSESGRRMALQRIRAIQHSSLNLAASQPAGFGTNSTDVFVGKALKA